ncbi:BgTH12-01365 [Blumeria graminis f. sp. triticale]|uniref:BgTH12-01365 n=1 Tax=Blumeria graminis f. sp. triticale TaxID=1689686 RepID=A0A9W4GDU5_BLUGR|nr:BgTH12-01365 [Blumeria graminis f. sp. triticale]
MALTSETPPGFWRLSVSLSQLSNKLPQFLCCGCSGVYSFQITSVPLSCFPLQETCPTSISLPKSFILSVPCDSSLLPSPYSTWFSF